MNRQIGIKASDILLPAKGVDLEKWAVVACDQFTSEKKYWEDVREYVGSAPSTLNLIFPECYLADSDYKKRIEDINKTMKSYISNNIFQCFKDSFVLVKRQCGSEYRLGLVASLDLECYSWEKDSKTIIRATEGTILSRIPPRKEIRKDAELEFPHIIVLISDKDRTVIEKTYSKRDKLREIYNTALMKNGGNIQAWLVDSENDKQEIYDAFQKLYEKLNPQNPLLFAMGDGNHSFATAKSCWEDIKKNLTEEEKISHPARFCLVEIENIFDPALVFEPIHRVFFKTDESVFIDVLKKFADGIEFETKKNINEILSNIEDQSIQRFGYCTSDKYCLVSIRNSSSNIVAGTLQKVIDFLIEKNFEIDYTHGNDITEHLGREKGNIGIFLPAISKDNFFETIIKDGSLPRKTFSMGNANEKRYYMEARKIK